MRIGDWSSDVCSSDLLAEAGELGLVSIAFEPLIIFVGQPGQTILGQIFEVRTIGEIDRPALVIIEKARDPFDRPVVARHQPRFLNEQIVITIGVERKGRSEEHTSELQSLMRISYAVFCLKQKINTKHILSNKDKTT